MPRKYLDAIEGNIHDFRMAFEYLRGALENLETIERMERTIDLSLAKPASDALLGNAVAMVKAALKEIEFEP